MTNTRLSTSQKSVYCSMSNYENDPVLNAIPNYFHLLYPSMLIEDIRLGIIKASSLNNSYNAIINPSDENIETLIACALSNKEYYRRNLSKSLYKFIEECAVTIMNFGNAKYELIFLSDPNSGKVVEFKLKYISPITLIWEKNRLLRWKKDKLYQYIPKEFSKEWKIPQYIELVPENILTFKPPQHLENKLKKIMVELAYLSKTPAPELLFQNDFPYVFDEHIQNQKLGIANATKEIGWNARFSLQDSIVEYYDLHRYLEFEKFKIELRDEILKTLNEVIYRLGKIMGFSVELKIEGLPTLEDVEDAKKHLKNGTKTFKEIVKSF